MVLLLLWMRARDEWEYVGRRARKKGGRDMDVYVWRKKCGETTTRVFSGRLRVVYVWVFFGGHGDPYLER
jgi:hypothetical protein